MEKYSHQEFKESLHETLDGLFDLVSKKNLAYGNSYEVVPSIMKILYPEGISFEQIDDALLIVRLLDKLKRIVQNNDPFGEDPWQDIAGYALLKLTTRRKECLKETPAISLATPEDILSPTPDKRFIPLRAMLVD